MKKRKTYKRINNIWRSYSDMMAGLLLMFILVMSISLVSFQKSYEAENEARREQEALSEELKVKEEEMQLQQEELEKQKQESEAQRAEIEKQKAEIEKKQQESEVQQAEIEKQKAEIEKKQQESEAQQAEIEAQKAEIEKKQQESKAQQAEIEKQKQASETQQAEIERQQEALEQQQIKLEQQQAETENQKRIMEEQQRKIDNIIGIKAELIADLSEEFQLNNLSVGIDEETGAIIFDANVLFAYDESTLTNEGKKLLNEMLPVYCKTLLQEKYLPYLSQIIIDGFTDSQGSFYYNLDLSQRRALAVAQYLLSIDADFLASEDIVVLESKLSANGRSENNLIYNQNGEEDAASSRRVEVKFRLTDEEMIKELQNIMG